MAKLEVVDTADWYPEDFEEEDELCDHGYPGGYGCPECEFWEYVDYVYDRCRDK